MFFDAVFKNSAHQVLGNLEGRQDLPRLQRKRVPLPVPHTGHPGQDTCCMSLQVLSLPSSPYFPSVETGFEGDVEQLYFSTSSQPGAAGAGVDTRGSHDGGWPSKGIGHLTAGFFLIV